MEREEGGRRRGTWAGAAGRRRGQGRGWGRGRRRRRRRRDASVGRGKAGGRGRRPAPRARTEEDAGVEAPAAAGHRGATARGRRRGGKVRSSGGGIWRGRERGQRGIGGGKLSNGAPHAGAP